MAKNSERILEHKRRVVHDVIWNAAIDLFGEKGFDQITVDDVVAAAGVSQRTFFRYFASKSDLLSRNMLSYAEALKEAIKACPKSVSGFGVLRHTVLEMAAQVVSSPRARDVMAIATRCSAAREAQLSRMAEVESNVAQAYAARMKKGRDRELTARLLAGTTLTILDVTFRLWFEDGSQDAGEIAEQVMKRLRNLVADADV